MIPLTCGATTGRTWRSSALDSSVKSTYVFRLRRYVWPGTRTVFSIPIKVCETGTAQARIDADRASRRRAFSQRRLEGVAGGFGGLAQGDRQADSRVLRVLGEGLDAAAALDAGPRGGEVDHGRAGGGTA